MPPSRPTSAVQTRRRNAGTGATAAGRTPQLGGAVAGSQRVNPFFSPFPTPLIGTKPRPIFDRDPSSPTFGKAIGTRPSEREELLRGLGGSGDLSPQDASGEGFLGNIPLLSLAPFGAGPNLPAQPGGNPLASFGNVGPVITMGGPATTAAFARLAQPPPQGGQNRGAQPQWQKIHVQRGRVRPSRN